MVALLILAVMTIARCERYVPLKFLSHANVRRHPMTHHIIVRFYSYREARCMQEISPSPLPRKQAPKLLYCVQYTVA